MTLSGVYGIGITPLRLKLLIRAAPGAIDSSRQIMTRKNSMTIERPREGGIAEDRPAENDLMYET